MNLALASTPKERSEGEKKAWRCDRRPAGPKKGGADARIAQCFAHWPKPVKAGGVRCCRQRPLRQPPHGCRENWLREPRAGRRRLL